MYNRDRFFYFRYRLLKPYDRRAKLCTVISLITELDIAAYLIQQFFILLASHFKYLAMQVEYLCRACPFMQIIDILCDDRDIKILFQLCQSKMSCIRICISYILTTHIVKVKYH